ncbi:85/88 kDa calcium-independent phospholipase A2-like [Mytilus californianus]|uniref:85/88 kDa calcium-independent phospholipase A2-like n=1 Tax=Mytilus californianus TaxID=6549 RepID=UPI002247D6BB|nr:85/88 kDa calcium-independent phospholipase A2-like [Mytilus californianus]
MLKNLVDGFKGLVEVAGASINPYTVNNVKLENYKDYSKRAEEGHLILYKKHSCYDCIVVSTSNPVSVWSIFRLTSDGEAYAQFGLYASKLNVLIARSSSVFVGDNLQKITDVIKEHSSWTPIHIAAYLGFYEFIRQPDIKSKINDKTTTSEATPLMTAVMGKQFQCIEQLLQSGASLHRQDNSGDSAYHYAVRFEPKCIPILSQYDRDGVKDFYNNKGQTALYMACEKGMPDAVEELLKAGVRPDISACDMLPIHVAMKTNNIRNLELICEKHVGQLFAKDHKYGGTPAHWVRKREVAERLLKLGCDVNIASDTGHTPLHVMLKKDRRDCIMELLVHGADTRAGDVYGNTPLHVAIQNDDVEFVRLFIVFGADVNMKNKAGQTPRHLASVSKEKNKDTILYMLHICGARRCGHTTKGCCKGCVMEGSYDGTADDAMKSVLTIDREAIVDEMLSSFKDPDQDVDTTSSLDKHRVLCLDGGGIRGLILVQLLIAIEDVAGIPIKDCFDWISGTSTGGLLALGIATGKPLAYMKGLYVRLKDEVFKGSRPYPAESFEAMLKKELGETKVMTDIKGPKVLVTGVLADRHPSQLHFFRTYHPTLQTYEDETHPKDRVRPPPPHEQLVWEAARSSGAAPTYFKQARAFVDGGMISNNPTLDTLTEIHEYNCGLKLRNEGHLIKSIGCVVSLGTGRIPVIPVESVDVFRPEGIFDVKRVVTGFTGLVNMMIDQATLSEGPPVNRSRAWCSMLNIPFYRFSPRISEDFPLDCHDNKSIITMMWETQCYIVANREKIQKLGILLKNIHDAKQKSVK